MRKLRLTRLEGFPGRWCVIGLHNCLEEDGARRCAESGVSR